MELSSVLLARVLGQVETHDLNPRGETFGPDLIAGIAERFRFQKFPQKVEETDEQKGIEFYTGIWNGVNVERLVIYAGAINVDTHASTDDSKRIVHEGLAWAADKFKLRYAPGMIKRWRYISQLSFRSDAPLLGGMDSPTARLLEKIGQSVAEILEQPFTYHPVRVDLDFPRFERQTPVATFSIQRRSSTPFSENKYFSEAPLPTETHRLLLEQYEADLVSGGLVSSYLKS